MKAGLSARLWNYERVKFLETHQRFVGRCLQGIEAHGDYRFSAQARDFLIVVRARFGYSPKTYDGDILWSWLNLWKDFKKALKLKGAENENKRCAERK